MGRAKASDWNVEGHTRQSHFKLDADFGQHGSPQLGCVYLPSVKLDEQGGRLHHNTKASVHHAFVLSSLSTIVRPVLYHNLKHLTQGVLRRVGTHSEVP